MNISNDNAIVEIPSSFRFIKFCVFLCIIYFVRLLMIHKLLLGQLLHRRDFGICIVSLDYRFICHDTSLFKFFHH